MDFLTVSPPILFEIKFSSYVKFKLSPSLRYISIGCLSIVLFPFAYITSTYPSELKSAYETFAM